MKVTIIKPKNKLFDINLREIWEYRHLLFSLAWRDIKVRYIQSFLGMAWLILKPLISLVILVFVFGRIVKVDTEGIPSVLFTISGLTLWVYFSSLLSEAGNSILGAQEMVKKIYFPRIILPLSKSISGFLEFCASLLILTIIAIYYRVDTSLSILIAPLFIVLGILFSVGIGIIISGLSIRFRDLKFVVPFIVQIGLFFTPIAYSSNMIPEKYSVLLYLNPLIGVIDGFRWSIFGSGEIASHVWFSCISIPLVFIASILIFSRVERTIADII